MTETNNYFDQQYINAKGFKASGRVLYPMFPTRGREWFVDGGSGAASDDGTGGSDSNDGLSWDSAVRTMAQVFAYLESGDAIYFTGNIREQLTTPAGVFDVRVIGAGNRPRHADAHTTNNGYRGATWKSPASAAATTALCRIIQQGWSFENILVAPPSDYGAFEWVRNAASGDSERDASHGLVRRCRFAAGKYQLMFGASSFTENLFDMRIEDCDFEDATTLSFFNGGGGVYRMKLLGNRFLSNVSHVDLPLVESFVMGNSFGKYTTKALDLTGGSDNQVVGNYMSGDYSTAAGSYVAGTSDNWIGNFAQDVAETEVEAGGETNAVPAS